MIIYEVNLQVKAEIYQEFKSWLQKHVDEMLEIEGFVKAQTFTFDETSFSVHYSVESPEALESYFTNHAPRMRQDGLDRFGENFSANRRILTPA